MIVANAKCTGKRMGTLLWETIGLVSDTKTDVGQTLSTTIYCEIRAKRGDIYKIEKKA
jgi:hypothetical protein